MKILFLNLPFAYKVSRASRWPEKTKSGTLYYPYWLAYAAGFAEKQGFLVSLIDAIADSLNEQQVIDAIDNFAPDIIVAEFTTPTYFGDIEYVKKIRNSGYQGIIAIGGTHVTALPETVLADCPEIDIILRNEYDVTITEIAQERAKKEILGISYIESGRVLHNEDRPPLTDLDALPFVSQIYKKNLDIRKYFYALAQHPMIQIVSSRGCPHQCNFCSYPQTMGGRNYRTRSPQNFVEELESITQEMPEIKEIFIEDDTFTVDKKRVVEICNLIIARGLKLTWSANVRADVPYDVLKKMKDAGCRLVVVGYESGNEQILKNIGKGITLAQSVQFAENTKKLGLKVFGCFMIGLSGETRQTIKDTYDFAIKLDPDMVFFQQAVPFPGTCFYSEVKKNNMLITEDFGQWVDEQGRLNCLIDYPEFTHADLEQIRDSLMAKYYFSARYIFRTLLGNSDPAEFLRVVKAGLNYIWFRVQQKLKVGQV
jgi:Fe-S oxidoreductase